MSVKKMMSSLLPATVQEIAVLTGVPVKKVNSRLYYLKKIGMARPLDRRAGRSRLWVRV